MSPRCTLSRAARFTEPWGGHCLPSSLSPEPLRYSFRAIPPPRALRLAVLPGPQPRRQTRAASASSRDGPAATTQPQLPNPDRPRLVPERPRRPLHLATTATVPTTPTAPATPSPTTHQALSTPEPRTCVRPARSPTPPTTGGRTNETAANTSRTPAPYRSSRAAPRISAGLSAVSSKAATTSAALHPGCALRTKAAAAET